MEQDTLNRGTLKNDILEVLLEEGFALDAGNSEDVFIHLDRFHCMEIVDRIVEVIYHFDPAEDTVKEDVVWVIYDGEVHWNKPEGAGFIYHNLIGVKRTRREARAAMERRRRFGGGDFLCEANDENGEKWKRNNYRIVLMKYNLDGPTIFDANH